MANHVLTCQKALKDWASAYEKIKGVEAKRKAREGIQDLFSSVVGVPGTANSGPTVTLTVDASEMPVGASVSHDPTGGILPPNYPVESKGMAFVDEGEAGPGIMEGDLEPAERDIPPVEMVDGWPMRAEIKVIGLAPNRRMLKGVLGEKFVSVERKPGWANRVYPMKLIRAGIAPLYRICA